MPRFLIILIFIYSGGLTFGQNPNLMLPIGHTGIINSVKFSPDGKYIVTASDDFTAKVWDAQNGNILINLPKQNGKVKLAEFSPDSKLIMTYSDDGFIKIWLTESGRLVQSFSRILLDSAPNFIAPFFSPDNKSVIAVIKSEIKLMDVKTGVVKPFIKPSLTDISFIRVSPDNKYVVVGYKSSVDIWDLNKEKNPITIKDEISDVFFNPERNRIAILSGKAIEIINTSNWHIIDSLKGNTYFIDISFSPDGKLAATSSDDSTVKIWNTEKFICTRTIKNNEGIGEVKFSPNGETIAISFGEEVYGSTKIWDVKKEKFLFDIGCIGLFVTVEFSTDGSKVCNLSNHDLGVKILDTKTGDRLFMLDNKFSSFQYADFNPNGNEIITSDPNAGPLTSPQKIKIWDILKAKPSIMLGDGNDLFYSAKYSHDGKKIITTDGNKTIKMWDVRTGAYQKTLDINQEEISYAEFSPNDKSILLNSRNSGISIVDAFTGKQNVVLKKFFEKNGFNSVEFSPDGQTFVTTDRENTPIIWNASNGKLVLRLGGINHQKDDILYAKYSNNGKLVAGSSYEGRVKIWDATTGKLISSTTAQHNYIEAAEFNPKGDKVVSVSGDGESRVFNTVSGKEIFKLENENDFFNSARFSRDGKKIVTTSSNSTFKVWDAEKGTLLYCFSDIQDAGYLITDAYNHYDGDEAARKMLYFTCGTEMVTLDQIKDQLWVPGLAQRVLNDEQIDAPKLSDLDICGFVPLVEKISENQDEYRYKIVPRTGGFKEAVLSVNGIEVKRFHVGELSKIEGGYELIVKKHFLDSNFVNGQDNPISVRAYTAHNGISSRRVTDFYKSAKKSDIHPNLYAVMVGINNYKDMSLKLNYPENDASELSKIISISAQKLLNNDKSEHVFVYTIKTGDSQTIYPDKSAIRRVLIDSIGKKATANDILIIFLAGHGTMKNNEFLFLTAESSSLNTIGITSQELFDWTKPENIRAQKRMLILDACQSGQVLDDLAGGNGNGWRSTEYSDRIKDIDRLNERSGMFILSAAARDQEAQESKLYSHGVLTYALLKTIKERPEILENGNLLNVGNWFLKAESIVNDLVTQDIQQPGEVLRQDPKIMSSGNFDIGIVDDEVINNIGLKKKAVVAEINFQNEDIDMADTIGLNHAIRKNLLNVMSRTADSEIIYNPIGNSDDVYSINGRYTINANKVFVKVKIFQHHNAKKSEFEIKGDKTDLDALAAKIVKETVEKLTQVKETYKKQ